MVNHDHPVNKVKPIAQTDNNASVAPNRLNHGNKALLNKLPITPPELKL